MVTHLAEEVGDILLSVVLTHLGDSPAVALVRDSAGRGDFLLVEFLVAEITAALVTVVSVTIVSFFNSSPGLHLERKPTRTGQVPFLNFGEFPSPLPRSTPAVS